MLAMRRFLSILGLVILAVGVPATFGRAQEAGTKGRGAAGSGGLSPGAAGQARTVQLLRGMAKQRLPAGSEAQAAPPAGSPADGTAEKASPQTAAGGQPAAGGAPEDSGGSPAERAGNQEAGREEPTEKAGGGAGRPLSIFGMTLFARPVKDLVPDLIVPVSSDYVLGPGDTLIIHYWTATEDQTFRTEVSRDGTIELPAVGDVPVAQLTYAEARDLVDKEIRRTKDVTMVTVRLGPLRSIHVWVTGYVQQLGLHTVSALSSAFNALVVSGGPTGHGSLRRIEIKRNDELVGTLDLYDFLLRGDRSEDLRLQSGDTIFVPVRGPHVRLEGEVKNPAIYELKGETTLAELLEMAGGFTGSGYRALLQIERTQEGRERVLQDVILDDLMERARDVVLRDGDLVRVSRVGSEIRDRVEIEGNIERPGVYEWSAGLTVAALIERAGPLLAESHLARAEIRRMLGEERSFRHSGGAEPGLQSHQIIPFDLGAVLRGEIDPALERLDRVVIYRRDQVRPPPRVSIEGAVQRPGTYEMTSGMRVKDLVFEAGGELEDAYLGEAIIVSRKLGGAATQATEIERDRIDLAAALQGDGENNVVLHNHDTLVVQRRQLLSVEVQIRGAVRHPGHYVLARGARVSDLLTEAGGPLSEAFLPGAIFSRQTVRVRQQAANREYVRRQRERILWLQSREMGRSTGQASAEKVEASVFLQKELLAQLEATPVVGRLPLRDLGGDGFAGSPYDVVLNSGDSLEVPERPASVLVVGHVSVPGATLFVPGESLDYYLSQVGGVREDADEDQIYVVKADGSVVKVYEQKSHRISWDARRGGWFEGVINEEIVELGDMIYVPPQAEFVGGWDMTRDIVDIVFKTAVSAGVVVGVWR